MFPRCGMAQEGDEARHMTIKDIARQCGVSVMEWYSNIMFAALKAGCVSRAASISADCD